MHVGEILFFLLFNLLVILGLHFLQTKKIEKRLKRLRQEMQEMEDLVVAIIEEFEATTATKEATPVPQPVMVPDLTLKALPSNSQVVQPALDSKNANQHSNSANIISDPKHQKVVELWQKGSEISEIAKALTIGPSEVRLILGLYKYH